MMLLYYGKTSPSLGIIFAAETLAKKLIENFW